MTEHNYPSRYPKGAHWATDFGWDIMDRIAPGAITDTQRFFLAGLISGKVMTLAEDPAEYIKNWEQEHGAASEGDTR